MPDLSSYRRDTSLLLVHPILQHLLDLLSRRLVLVLVLLGVVDRGFGLSILCDGSFLVVGRRCGRTGEYGFGRVDAIGVVVQGRYTSWIERVRFCLERTAGRFDRRVFWGRRH